MKDDEEEQQVHETQARSRRAVPHIHKRLQHKHNHNTPSQAPHPPFSTSPLLHLLSTHSLTQLTRLTRLSRQQGLDGLWRVLVVEVLCGVPQRVHQALHLRVGVQLEGLDGLGDVDGGVLLGEGANKVHVVVEDDGTHEHLLAEDDRLGVGEPAR